MGRRPTKPCSPIQDARTLCFLKSAWQISGNAIAVATACDLFLDYSQAHHSQSAFTNYKHFLKCLETGLVVISRVIAFGFPDLYAALNGVKLVRNVLRFQQLPEHSARLFH